jgi:hypothetical protein
MIDSWAFRANDTVAGKTDKNFAEDRANDLNYRTALEAVRAFRPPNGDRAVVMRRFAESVAREFPDEFFDFMYIDAGHDYPNVMKDLRVWWPKLRVGGMMAGDDFADMHDTFPKPQVHQQFAWGVKSAVANFSRCAAEGCALPPARVAAVALRLRAGAGCGRGAGHGALWAGRMGMVSLCACAHVSPSHRFQVLTLTAAPRARLPRSPRSCARARDTHIHTHTHTHTHAHRSVGSPFFLTFADHSHFATVGRPSSVEFDDAVGKLRNAPQFARSHRFYPAW